MNDTTLKDRTIFIILIGLIVMTACAIFIVIFYMFFSGSLPWNKTPTAQTADQVWLRIQNQQKMVVGVSADYRPFAFIGPGFSLQGYDLALIQEVGKRLNIPVELHNMAFDGLFNALTLGQIDVAIAAISVTPEREALNDFSNVYYVGDDALLSKSDANLQVASPNDLVNYRVGVQKGSVYEDWMRDTLITPGLMAPQNLLTYDSADQALQALVNLNPAIDLYLLDFQPAQAAIMQQPVIVVAHGLHPQRYAIAIPQGAVTLQGMINQTLTEMQNDGTLAALARQYLNVENPPPLPTPAPTPAPTQLPPTPVGCLDGMKFVQDLTFPDSNMISPPQVQPGSAIQKGWRILNTGTCIWDNTYVLTYVGSAPPNAPVGGNPVAVQGQVAPGQSYDIYANIMAPAQPGRYQSFWNLRNGKGVHFGDRIWAGFDVVAQATPTSGPPAPTINSFRVDRTQIVEGQCISLNWQFSGQGITFSRIFRNGRVLLFDLPFIGSANDCPPGTGQMEYRLNLDSNQAGSTFASQIVTIYPAVQPTVPPPPTPEQPPVVYYFYTDSNEILAGECVNISWAFGGSGALGAQIYRNGDSIASNLDGSGTIQDCPAEPGQTEYLLTVASMFSGSAQSTIYIQVLIPIEPPIIQPREGDDNPTEEIMPTAIINPVDDDSN